MYKKKFELLAPAGDLEKLKTAIIYGADAVYFGGEMFSLRAGAGNFTIDDIKEGIKFAHERGRRCYIAVNVFARNQDIEPLEEYFEELRSLNLDAFIVSDPGVLDVLLEVIPKAPVHLSTQANMTNYRAADFWYRLGVKRIILARELSFREIREIRERIPLAMELEAFIHGSMCISYSGRCLLSNFMADRDANRGMCAHPCRWKYALVEETRPGKYFPIEEDERGAYILNSNDLCMIEHIPEFAESGIDSAKIEGRMKSVFYVATVVHAYRQAIDSYFADPGKYAFKDEWLSEAKKASSRKFTNGFYFGRPASKDQNYATGACIQEYTFTGLVKGYDEATGFADVEQKNKMNVGDEIEVFGPDISFFTQEIKEMYDLETGEALKSAPHPQQMLKIKMERPVKPYYMLRKKNKESDF